MDFQTQYSEYNPYGSMTWYDNSNLSTDIFNSLTIQQGSFFQNLSFGSQLYKVGIVNQASTILVQQYAEQALAWLLTAGYASAINATAAINDYQSYIVNIVITQTSGVETNYNYNFNINLQNGTYNLVGPQ